MVAGCGGVGRVEDVMVCEDCGAVVLGGTPMRWDNGRMVHTNRRLCAENAAARDAYRVREARAQVEADADVEVGHG